MSETLVGPYRILGELGSGGMGKVYLAEDPRLKRKVALKTLHDTAASREARRQLLKEARAAAGLNHPNIAGIYDVLESEDGAHIVMEYVQGQTLAERIRPGPLALDAFGEIAVQLCDALAEAHDAGIVHRDLKPANVAITPSGRVKVLDFGLARRPASDTATTTFTALDASDSARVVMGTPAYIAPEQLEGRPADARSDIYSLGVVLFEMLTGRCPFLGADVGSVFHAALHEPRPSARSLNPGVPQAVDEVVQRALARRSEERHPSVRDLRGELTRALGTPGALVVGPDPQRPLAALRRGARPAALASAVLLIFVALVGYWLPRRNPSGGELASSPPVVAVLPLTVATDDPADRYLGVGIADVLITALSRVPDVNVLSRGATLKYDGTSRELGPIARELGATLVVDGAVQRAGDKLRVTLSLVKADDGVVAWSESWDGRFAEVFALQSQVAAAVAAELRIALSPADERRVGERPTGNEEAFAEYSQGQSFLERQDVPENVERAIALLESAIGRDAGFARARAELSRAYWLMYERTNDAAWMSRARDESLEALRLDPQDASVRRALANVLAGAGRTKEAIEELERAIALRPSDDEAHRVLGRLLASEGRVDEGEAEVQRAIRLRPAYWVGHYELGLIRFQAGRYAESIRAFERVVELQPDNAWGYYMLGTNHHALGQKREAAGYYRKAVDKGFAGAYTNLGALLYSDAKYEEALAAFTKAAELEPGDPLKHRNLGDVLRRLGREDEARRAYEEALTQAATKLAVQPGHGPTLALSAVLQAKLGRFDEADRRAEAALAGNPAGTVLFRLAVARAIAGREDEALRLLDRAVRSGYSAELAREDEDLAALAARPGFELALQGKLRESTKGGVE